MLEIAVTETEPCTAPYRWDLPYSQRPSMLALLGVALALTQQVQIGPSTRRPPVVRDSTADTSRSSGRHRNRGVRRPVTAEDQATAFKDATAKATLLHARAARMMQDSTLTAYDAMSYQRISAGMGFPRSAATVCCSGTRVRPACSGNRVLAYGWKRAASAPRYLLPEHNDEAKKEIRQEMSDPDMNASIPYFPGYEPLWVGSNMARAQVDESEIVNPIAEGAEAYYTYQTGDSVSFTLPNKTVIQLRELRVRPREPKWNLAVGSLWFDTKSGQLVRAAYRMSIPMDIWAVAQEDDPKSMDDVPVWVKPMITPMKAEISAIAVEYGLHEGKFWLPRLRLAEGSAQVSFMHVPFKMEESFKYASVNGEGHAAGDHAPRAAPHAGFVDGRTAG